MYACIYARMYALVYDIGQIVIWTQDKHTTGTQDTRTRTRTPPEHHRRNTHTRGREETTGKGRNTGKAEKPAYIGKIAHNEKKYKKVKKNLEI